MFRLSLLFSASVLLLAGLSAEAQINSNPSDDLANGSSRPATLANPSPFVKWLLRRFHTVELNTIVSQMQAEGTKDKNLVLGVTTSGAMVYQYELQGNSIESTNETGRNAGMQFVPFNISLTGKDQYYVTFNVFSFRNMNALFNTPDYEDMTGFFRVVDQVDFAVFKFDHHQAYKNIDSREITMAAIEGKVDILGSRVNTRYLAIKAGGDAGFLHEKIEANGQTYSLPGEAVKFGVKYGLEFNTESKNGFRVNVQALLQNRWNHDEVTDPVLKLAYDPLEAQYSTENQAWAARKDAYSVSHQVHDLSDADYSKQSGDQKPIEPLAPNSILSHQSFYFNPWIELSKRVSKAGAHPVRIGLGASGSIALKDVISGGSLGTLNQANQQQQLIRAKLFINF